MICICWTIMWHEQQNKLINIFLKKMIYGLKQHVNYTSSSIGMHFECNVTANEWLWCGHDV